MEWNTILKGGEGDLQTITNVDHYRTGDEARYLSAKGLRGNDKYLKMNGTPTSEVNTSRRDFSMHMGIEQDWDNA